MRAIDAAVDRLGRTRWDRRRAEGTIRLPVRTRRREGAALQVHEVSS
jgi:hypothetical protein